ncbi:MAG TPA: DegT/DnrJ/EryC1/StrS family aminotransferase [Polyangia bacterium]
MDRANADPPPIALTDLAGDHAPLEAALLEAAARVLRSGRYILGPEVAAFEGELAAASGVAHAVGLSSGTDALLAMLMAAGVGPGDEVVTSPFSFFATAAAIARVGARPVFADIDPDTLNMDAARAIARIGPRTKAVMVVHIFGRCAPTAALEAACAARGIPLFEDAAQAIGAVALDGRRVGARTAGATLSFFPTKNLGGFGDGGAVLTDDADFAARLRRLRAQGADRKNHHVEVGGNFRLDELQAALLRVKLPHLPAWTAARRRVVARYHEALRGLPIGLPSTDPGAVWNQFVVRVPADRRAALIAHLAADGVATEIYYPEPLHLQPALQGLAHAAGDFPNAERACREVLALPPHPSLDDSSITRVTRSLRAFFDATSSAS